jgi:hypothetical protein
MAYNAQNYWVFGLFLCPVFQKMENTTFWKLDLFLKHIVFYFLEYRTMKKVQKLINSEGS